MHHDDDARSPHAALAPPWWSPAVFVATCGGVGRLGLAPGTAGAAVGAVIAAVLAGWELSPIVEAGILVAINLVGVPVCTRAAALLGRGSDPGAIVYDEAASLPLGLLVIPAAARSPIVIAAAFLLHRLFDISKLPPGKQLERLPGGLGIMADDWGAAAWMALCLAASQWLWAAG
ncbi:MAG: phosphatidylglycerophosphatase A [Planctomycetia bacterium]